ncbi:MAG: RNA methyltransferase [Planctomycetota bacterium]|nr:RNA methyltransferase [Planctomycetota bacterium]
MITITSPQNARIKRLVRLRKRSERDSSQLTVIDGVKEIRCAMEAGAEIAELYVCEELLADGDAGLAAEAGARASESYMVSEEVFRKGAYGDRVEGLIAVVPIPMVELKDLSLGDCPLLLVIEGLEKPGNLGAVIRSADAAGVTGVIACEAKTDLFNPNAIRASIGTIFSVPVIRASSSETIGWLKNNGIHSIAATPNAETNHTDADFRRPTALVLGSEHHGLTDTWLEGADATIRIPMQGKADSLNLAMSATILAFEAARQRGW